MQFQDIKQELDELSLRLQLQLQASDFSNEEFVAWRDQAHAAFRDSWDFAVSTHEFSNDQRIELREWHGLAWDSIYQSETYQRYDKRWDDACIQKEYEESLNIEVDGRAFKALKRIDVLWNGWGCDEYAWLVEDDGVKKIVMSNHGQLHFAKYDTLAARVKAYREAIVASEELLKECQQ